MAGTSRRSTYAAIGIMLLCAAAIPAGAQDAGGAASVSGSFGDRIDVDLVDVDVWVSDKQGLAVTGLGVDDFKVLHDGKPVTISHFNEVRAGRSVGTPPRQSRDAEALGESFEPREVPAHVILYFDRSRLHPNHYEPLVKGVRELLDAEGVEPERVLVLRQDRDLTVAAPLGSSRKQLEAALARVSEGTAAGMDLDREEELALEAIRTAWERSQDTLGSAAAGIAAIPAAPGPPEGGGGSGTPQAVVGGAGSGSATLGGPDACGPFMDQIRPVLDRSMRLRAQRAAVTLDNLSQTARLVSGLPGVKSLLYLSDGLGSQPGSGLASYAMGLCPAAGADLMTGALSQEIGAAFLELTRHANTNRVTIYSVQATGLRAAISSSAAAGRGARGGGGTRARGGFDTSKLREDRDGLVLIADQTGGRSIFDRNELGAEFGQIGREIGTYYSLAYELPEEGKARGHRIEVKMRDRSLIPRYRGGYLVKDSRQRLTEKMDGALNLGITDNPLSVRLGVGDVQAGEDGGLRLPLHVMVPVENIAFLPQNGSAKAEVFVRVVARNVASQALAVQEQTFRVTGSPGAVGLADLAITLDLEEGTYLSVVGVQDADTHESSFVSTVLRVSLAN